MNLIEKLIRVDKETVEKKETKKIRSARLTKLLGEETEITIQEVSGRKHNDIMQMMFDEKGKRNISAAYDTNLMFCVNGIVEPDLKDPALLEHFNAATPKDLAAILFQAEAGTIADEIIALSGLKTEEKEIAQMNGDTLEVIEKGKTIPGFHIKQGERILESSYSENMDDMVNRVYVYNSSNKKIGILTNTRWANMYGIFQSAITVDSGNGKQEAMNELKGISKNASLTSTGDYRCVSGLGVIIEDSRTGLKGRFWIESDSHEWKNGSYTMKLDLEFKNIMDTQEEDEEQTSSSLSDLSESSALEDVLNQARSWIGIGENPPGSNHNEITVLYGMDAAWCCMFIWACFNKSGHADLFMGGAKEAYCFNVRDYYQARGKWGSTPKKGALVIYGGQGHIGIVESVNSAGGYTSIEGNYGDDVKRRDSHQNVLGFCYIDYPVTKSAEGSDEVISGTTVAVPGSVAQTGIIKDYTNYSYFFGRWNSGSTQKIIADLWENNGKQGKNGIATINGYYLIALRPVFGSAGDVVSVVLEDGARFNAIIADEKGDDAGNQWGHVYSGAVSIVEFESLGNSETNNGAQLNIGQWAGKKVTAIINGGRYSGL